MYHYPMNQAVPQLPTIAGPLQYPPATKSKKQRIIPPERRKKVAQACDSCKKRKQRCNGLQPCDICLKRKMDCQYTCIDRRILKASKKNPYKLAQLQQQGIVKTSELVDSKGQYTSDSLGPDKQSDLHQKTINRLPSASQTLNNPFVITESSQPPPTFASQASDSFSFPLYGQHHQHTTVTSTDSSSSHNPLQGETALGLPMNLPVDHDFINNRKNSLFHSSSRVLLDKSGNLNYIGESSPSAYLLQCRKVFQRTLGASTFSDDPDKFVIIEAPVLGGDFSIEADPKLPPRKYANYLLQTFLNNSNNIVYILEDQTIRNLIDKVYKPRSTATSKDICLVYLVFAIASVFARVELSTNLFPFPAVSFIHPQIFHEYALSTLYSTEEDGKLWMVEVHLLLFFFHQFSGKRNTAWIKLGDAIRYAQALGLHRSYVNSSFKDPTHVLHRRKLFRSLYIMDRMSALYTGRPISIKDKDWDDLHSVLKIDDFQNKILKVCELNGKVLTDIYFNQSLNISTAIVLSKELKQYSIANPINPLSENSYTRPLDHRYFLPHIIHLHGLMLLSRPFFHFIVLEKLNLINYDKSKNLSQLNEFFRSCVNSSLLTITVIQYVYYQNIHPFKPLTLISSVFQAGLIIGMMLLLKSKGINTGDILNDELINLELLSDTMETSIKLLGSYGEVDESSLIYSKILTKMVEVTITKPNINKSTAVPVNNQENYKKILRFQDWLFPKIENIKVNSNINTHLDNNNIDDNNDNDDNDGFLKDIAGFNNFDPSCSLFLDDFLFNVLDKPSSRLGLRNDILN